MKRLHTFAFYAVITPLVTLGAGSVLAEKSTDQNVDREQQSTQHDEDAEQYGSHPAKENAQSDQGAKQSTSEQGKQRAKDSGSHPARESAQSDQSRMKHQGYMSSAPANGMQVSNLIGAKVTTTGDEDVGPVSDLVIDENGQIVAVVVGVGGFLGLGERYVAIGWDDVTRSDTSDDDEQELRVDVTREDLRAAPEFKTRD